MRSADMSLDAGDAGRDCPVLPPVVRAEVAATQGDISEIEFALTHSSCGLRRPRSLRRLSHALWSRSQPDRRRLELPTGPVPTSKTRPTACVKAFVTDAVVAGLKARPGIPCRGGRDHDEACRRYSRSAPLHLRVFSGLRTVGRDGPLALRRCATNADQAD